jgi:hypothetical protein
MPVLHLTTGIVNDILDHLIEEIQAAGDGIHMITTGWKRRLYKPIENFICIADWKDSAALYVRQKLFDKKQFMTDEELMFGGTMHTKVGVYRHQYQWGRKS